MKPKQYVILFKKKSLYYSDAEYPQQKNAIYIVVLN